MERDIMKSLRGLKSLIIIATIGLGVLTIFSSGDAQGKSVGKKNDKSSAGKHLFERETFGGNGRTCLTCHSLETGTVSPEEAQARFAANPHDPLFAHDGSDDGIGNGVSRMLSDATILVEIPLPENVSLADDPEARSVIVRRGIPTTLNTPALDPLLMLDGRDTDLETRARNAIQAHFQSAIDPRERDLQLIAEFQLTDRFFSSTTLREFARGGPAPELPEGNTESERRGRRFYVDAPFDPAAKAGICAACHSGPMLNQTNQFLPLPVQPGARFQNVAVSEFNSAGNPVREFIFKNPDGTQTIIRSPDPGRALITGDARAFPGDSLNAFKIPSLWGVRRTAPYFHDNSAKTLDDLATHYARFFEVITGGAVTLSEQDKADMVAYLKLLE
jgi:cytochrome c peroxidase